MPPREGDHVVPAHVRHLERGIGGGEQTHRAGDPAEPGDGGPCSSPASAISCMPTQMPRNGRPCARHRSPASSASTMPGIAVQRAPCMRANAPTPGSTMRSALPAPPRDRRSPPPRSAPAATKRVVDRSQIARAIVDERDALSHGRRAFPSSRAPRPTCADRSRPPLRSARANALNAAFHDMVVVAAV